MYGSISEAGSVFLKAKTCWDSVLMTDALLLKCGLSFASSKAKASAFC